EGGQRQFHADLVAREVRITLGQLPAEFREAVKRVRIFGARDLAQRLADEIDLRLEAIGLGVELVTTYPPREFVLELPPGTIASPALSLAARHLAGQAARLEFLPPKVTAWQQISARYSSGKLRMTLTTAGALALVVGGAFGFQQAQLWRLQRQWAAIKTNVQQLQTIQDNIHQYKPWFDPSLRGMTILKQLSEIFPEDGAVTAQSIEIHDLSAITCKGVARDNLALLGTIKKLRALPEVADVNIGQTRGQSPAVQFTFAFHWVEGGSHAN
ncbi:MAG: hypothetical protein KGS61_06015, partial [Verrucomicrobia bacterium]|nr:hypothetical protein [Verrucomicrobiota bacterium]